MIKIRFTTKRNIPRSKALIVWNVVLSVLISLGISLPTAAITRAQLEFYAQNGIFFYNPDNTVGINSTTCISGSNTTGTGERVLEQSQLDLIEKLKPIYQAAASQYNFPWQILPAIHYRESDLELNSLDSDGIYQIIPKNRQKFGFPDYPSGPVSEDEFRRQTEDAAKFISNIITSNNYNVSNATDIKKIFLSYNGWGDGKFFQQQAVKYGFSADEPWEGSSYVMNKFDAARQQMLGGYKESNTYPDNRFGTYTLYTALGGSGNDGCYFAVAGGYYLAFGASGMSEDEALRLMAIFRDRMHFDDDPSKAGYTGRLTAHNDLLLHSYGFTYIGDNKETCAGGIAYNCVSFSRYFVNVYTEQASKKIRAPLGNGINVASNLTNGDYPAFRSCGAEAFAVFSGTGSGSAGHTGVILGINTNAGPYGEVITGEAACGSGEAGIKVVVYSLDEFTRRYDKFACAVNGVNLSVDDGYVYQFPEYDADHPINVVHIGT